VSTLAPADVRWRARRDPAGGPPAVSVAFLSDDDPRTAAVVAGIRDYVASLVGRPRRMYDPDVPRAIAGDRRLGNGLAAVCLDGYRWAARTFAEALPAHVLAALARAGVDGPSALRLRLFDLVNERFGGFVPAARRAEALGLLAAALGLDAGDADALATAMTLDAEEEAILLPAEPSAETMPGEQPSPPAAWGRAADLIGAYNRAVLAALLRQAEWIVFTVHAPDGALVRRLYALCRRLGVYCDVEEGSGDGEGGTGGWGAGIADWEAGVFRLALSGPDAVVAPPAAAGPRLAAVALRLLARLGPQDRGVARLVLRDRPYRLVLDPALLRLPGLRPGAADQGGGAAREAGGGYGRAAGPEPAFDSAVEARLARAFTALERQGRAAGWRLVREPAPLVAGGRVLIPDFALERGGRRVFVEVAGFWTPGYLARKRAALERLAPDVPLVLAVPRESVAALAGLPFPLVPYGAAAGVPVHTLLAVAERRYGDFAARTRGAAERLAAACAAAGGWLPERDLATVLGCHGPGEMARVLTAAPPPAGWEYMPGAGLCGPSLRDGLTGALRRAWADGAAADGLPLARVRALLPDAALPESDAALAAVVERLPGWCVAHGSLFEEARVRPAEAAPAPAIRGRAPAAVTPAAARSVATRRSSGKAGRTAPLL
jgi:predicted nuclease of restriction endonuclease-like RecB superfamily